MTNIASSDFEEKYKVEDMPEVECLDFGLSSIHEPNILFKKVKECTKEINRWKIKKMTGNRSHASF